MVDHVSLFSDDVLSPTQKETHFSRRLLIFEVVCLSSNQIINLSIQFTKTIFSKKLQMKHHRASFFVIPRDSSLILNQEIAQEVEIIQNTVRMIRLEKRGKDG